MYFSIYELIYTCPKLHKKQNHFRMDIHTYIHTYKENLRIESKITNHNPIRMIAFVRSNLSSNREALNAEIKIRANYAFDPNFPGDIFVAIIAMIQRSFPFAISLP